MTTQCVVQIYVRRDRDRGSGELLPLSNFETFAVIVIYCQEEDINCKFT